MEKLQINTPQNVNIEYALASIGTRMLALALDIAILMGYVYLVSFFMQFIFRSGMDRWSYTGLLMLLYLPVFCYHFLLETLLNGQTLGKLALKIKVVKLDGTRATVYEYFIRWVMNIVDIWMMSGVIGIVAAIASKKTQRIGDMAASTAVVSLKSRLHLMQTAYEKIEDDYAITFPQVVNLSDKDMNIIKVKYYEALNKSNTKVIDALCKKLMEVLEISKITISKKQFILTVMQDYYHYFKDK